MCSSGLVFAEESGAFSSRMLGTADDGFNFAYNNDPMTARTIGERTIDLLGSSDVPDGGQSSRYSISLDLENEDRDWSFEVTVTMEF